MNAMEAIKIKKNGGIIERKLDNGLTEVKEFYHNGNLWRHYFLNENGKMHGEFIWFWLADERIGTHKIFNNGELIKIIQG